MFCCVCVFSFFIVFCYECLVVVVVKNMFEGV